MRITNTCSIRMGAWCAGLQIELELACQSNSEGLSHHANRRSGDLKWTKSLALRLPSAMDE